MFYFYAIGSMLAYTVQGILIITFARKMDGLSLVFYRNTSFVVTLLPLLIGSTSAEFSLVAQHWPMFVLAGASGGLFLTMSYTAIQYLPIGTTNTLNKAITITVISLLGWIFADEILSRPAIILIGLIVVGIIYLSFQKNDFSHLNANAAFGFVLICVGAVFHAITNYSFAILSREISPLVSGYFWEISIAMASIIFIVLRKFITGTSITRVSPKMFLIIALCSWPTLLGTGLQALAYNTGPIAVVNAISAGSLVIMPLFGLLHYEEKLHIRQWICILCIFAGVVALRFV